MDLVDDAVEAILRSRGGDIGGLAAGYRDQDLQPPVIRLDPDDADLPLAMHRDLLAWWRGRAGPEGPPPAAAIAPDVLRPYLGRLILLEPVDGGADFRYRLYGSVIAQFTGFDLTGWLLSQTGTRAFWPPLITTYYFVVYRAAFRARRPCHSWVRLPAADTVYMWHRLLLPFAGPNGGIERLLLCTVPCDLDGQVLPAWQTMRG